MATTKKNQVLKNKVQALAKEILVCGALPWSEFVDKLEERGVNRNSAGKLIAELARDGKLARSKEKGQKVFYSLPESTEAAPPSRQGAAPSRPEKDFYKPFAQYLEYGEDDDDSRRLDECTKAIELGGNEFGGKWSTPDVIGVFRPIDSDSVQFPHEIVSAEIKTDDSSFITAFGQACAYRLFSHKVYLVIPKPKNDFGRIESLCHIYGIGLVYFDPMETPHLSVFSLQQLAQRHSPDMFYVNEYIQGDIADKLYERKRRKTRKR